jgi:Ca-activated chloride channel family protein
MHNFGELQKDDVKYFDFTLTNAGKDTVWILRIDEPYGIDAKFSSKMILPDSTVIVRIKYTPKRKGKFSADVPVWVSSNNTPIIFSVKGNAKSVDENESLACPDFKTNNKPRELFTPLTIEVKDKQTGLPVRNAKIELIWDGLIYKTLSTNFNGQASEKLKYDIYYFVVNADGYKTAETDFYVNNNNNTLVIEMEPLTPVDIAKIDSIKQVKETTPEPIDEINDDGTLSENLYAPNNIVFLIDVSVSMKQQGRLDLLKAAMIELLKSLRPIDKLAIVTYATDATVVMPSEYVTDKEKIIEIIQSLEAGGYTGSHKGMKKAYKVAEDNYIEKGNNEVIISTDGAFHLSGKGGEILETVAKYRDKGIKMSVVGIKNDKYAAKSMKEIAQTGNGNYINIANYSDAKTLLLDEIKKQSRLAKQAE